MRLDDMQEQVVRRDEMRQAMERKEERWDNKRENDVKRWEARLGEETRTEVTRRCDKTRDKKWLDEKRWEKVRPKERREATRRKGEKERWAVKNEVARRDETTRTWENYQLVTSHHLSSRIISYHLISSYLVKTRRKEEDNKKRQRRGGTSREKTGPMCTTNLCNPVPHANNLKSEINNVELK